MATLIGGGGGATVDCQRQHVGPARRKLLPEFAPESSARAQLSQLCRVLVQERDAASMVELGAVQALGLVVRADQGDPSANLALLLDCARHASQADPRAA